MLGWLGVALTEPMAGGKGPIGQIAWWLHLPTFQAYYQVAELGLVVLPIVFGALAYYNRRPGQVCAQQGICCCWSVFVIRCISSAPALSALHACGTELTRP
jgi:hypothetical protein